MNVDFLATERHFADHLAPIWKALPNRGAFIVPTQLAAYVRNTLGVPPADEFTRGDDPIVVASWGDTKRAMSDGRTLIIRAEHGIGQSYGGDFASYAGGKGAEQVGLFLCPNATSASRWSAAYPDASVEIIGSPKLDQLPAYQPSDIVAVSCHWDCPIAPETRTCLWQYGEAIWDLSKRRRLIGHAHPRMEGGAGRWFRNHGMEFVPNLADVMARAAVYVCDNSSSLYEFASTGRPVVVLNRAGSRGDPGYRKDVEHGLRFWEAANVGVQVDHPRELAAAVTLALEDRREQRTNREAALDIVYAYRTGAADRAAAAINAWVDARAAVAA